MSRKPTGPGRGGDAVEIVSAAIASQSRTASARAICHQLTAANVMTGTVVTRLSNLFERMRDMAFFPLLAFLLSNRLTFCIRPPTKGTSPNAMVFHRSGYSGAGLWIASRCGMGVPRAHDGRFSH